MKSYLFYSQKLLRLLSRGNGQSFFLRCIWVLCTWGMFLQAASPIHISRSACQVTAMPLCVAVVGSCYGLDDIITYIEQDLSYSKQFALTHQQCAPITHKKVIQDLFKEKYSLAIFISPLSATTMEWRLYDPFDAEMVKGKRYEITNDISRAVWGHIIAHDIWQAMTATQDPFLTVIAYIKRDKKGRPGSQLWITSFNGTASTQICRSSQILIAPSWNKNSMTPTITLSEFTPRNVRLKAIDLKGHSKIVLDVDGTSVGVSYAPQGNDVIYCRSGDIWYFHYDPQQHKGIHRLLISKNEPCACPSLLANGDVVYGCAGKIWYYHADTKEHEPLSSGYCVAPSYNQVRSSLVYSKKIQGVMQLCIYSLITKEEQQLTFDKRDKIDACWSPCGSYIACCSTNGKKGQIMTLHIYTGQQKFITDPDDDCAYPAWSPALHHNWLI